MLNKPKIQYPTLKSYIKSFYCKSNVLYPCLKCGGKGRYFDPNDEPDPIEGNKWRRTLRCVPCDGTGEGNFEEINKAWEEKRKRDELLIKEWEHKYEIFAEIKKKLSKKEWEIILEFKNDNE